MAIVDVVKYNGNSDVFAWKYPSEELGTWTQLIVNESQEAVLYKGGTALDVFPCGRYTLDTANIPILNKIINIPFGGRSPFTAEVWFVNRAYSLDVKWGTATPIQIQDPKYQIFCPIRANGTFGVTIKDSKLFLKKLVGTMSVFDRQSLVKFFRGIYITKVKDAISSYVVKKQISILEINAYIDELSMHMKGRIEPEMASYGIELANFCVNDISVPEDDTAVMKLKDALAKKAEMDIIGYSYQQERSFDTLEGATINGSSGASPIMGAGIGLGMGMGIGNSVGNSFGNIAKNINVGMKQKECPNCHNYVELQQRFCEKCGFDIDGEISSKKNMKRNICKRCGNILENDTKYCPKCGKKYNPCPECGADLEVDATVCDTCGYELPQKCPKCGANLDKNSRFCSKCGYSLMKTCPKCGAVVSGTSIFCLQCGERLGDCDEKK